MNHRLKKFEQYLVEGTGSLTESKKSLNKLYKELHGVTAKMADTVTLWKAAKAAGKDKEVQKYLKDLKALTVQKKRLEADVNDAVMGTDAEVELSATFEALSSSVNKRINAVVNRKKLNEFRSLVKSIVDDLFDEGFDDEDSVEWLISELKRTA